MLRLLTALILACLTACATTPAPSAKFAHTFVFLRTGPQRAQFEGEELRELMNGHMANIGRLANEHHLFVAGPFGSPSPEPELRGLFIFASSDTDEVKRLVQTDPSVAAGIFTAEIVPWSTDKDLRIVHRRDLEFDARRKADPSIEMMAGMSSYVLVFADEGARALRSMAPLRAQGKIALEGRFGGDRQGQAVFVIDTRDADGARALLATLASDVGSHRLIPWWGSAELR